MRLCLLGTLLAVGTWVRFTFPAFALPVVLDLAWNVLRNDKEDEDGKMQKPVPTRPLPGPSHHLLGR